MKGYAPGWVYRCPRCGAAGPAADLGLIRIAARSIGLRLYLRCPNEGRRRWLRIERSA